MHISRIVIRNFRNFAHLDVSIKARVTTVIGENNTGKSNLIYALRLVSDASLSSQFRQLSEHDIHSSVNLGEPQDIIISIEFTEFKDKDNELALVGTWQVSEDVARLTYRFRPKRTIIEAIVNKEFEERKLTLDDYHWELTGGGDKDPSKVTWKEDLGSAIRFSDLQHFHVVFLPALRDVRNDLRHSRFSPLAKLLEASNIPDKEKEDLVEIIRTANEAVAKETTFEQTSSEIQTAFSKSLGEAYEIGIRLGMADPSFTSITRSLTILFSNEAIKDFEPSRNGLGLNNILYISMLLGYFKKRVVSPNSAGQILLVEEPEAHLHPQLQRALFHQLQSEPFQTILTTHSTHISSQASLSSVVVLSNEGSPAISSYVPATDSALEQPDIDDLERYLDATRSTLLYARKVILVEGPAELFLVPALMKHLSLVDCDRHGITIVPIYGTHFHSYAKLFGPDAIRRKCAIIADGDLSPDVALDKDLGLDSTSEQSTLSELNNEFVKVFQCDTTLEREITLDGNIAWLANVSEYFGATKVASKLRTAAKVISSGEIKETEKAKLLAEMQSIVLKTAIRFGKARFAQKAASSISQASTVPKYIQNAVDWLTTK
ncbi:MAG: ATP-dependent nuclease [Candidatus Thorarchaeota archaeon]